MNVPLAGPVIQRYMDDFGGVCLFDLADDYTTAGSLNDLDRRAASMSTLEKRFRPRLDRWFVLDGVPPLKSYLGGCVPSTTLNVASDSKVPSVFVSLVVSLLTQNRNEYHA